MALNPAETFTLMVASAARASVTRASLITAPLEVVDDFDSLKLNFHLYDGDSISFASTGVSKAAPFLDGYASDLFLYNAADNTRTDHLWQRYRVLPIDQEWGEDGTDTLTVQGICYKSLTASRILKTTPPWFTAVDEAQIVKGVIDHLNAQGTSASGNLGIVTTTVTNTGQTRDRTQYKAGDNAFSILDDLSKVTNGPTWRVKPATAGDRCLFVSKLASFATATQPMVRGDNVLKLVRKAGTPVATAGFCPGTEVTRTAYVEETGLATDPRGLLEASRAASTSVINQSEVTEVAQGVVDDYSKPVGVWTATMDVTRWLGDSGYTPGQLVTIHQPPDVIDPYTTVTAATKTARVIELQVDVTSAGAVTVTYALVET